MTWAAAGRRRVLQALGGAGVLGGSVLTTPVRGAGADVGISFKRCQVAFVTGASALDTLAIYYTSGDGNRTARYDVPTTASEPRRGDPLRVSYNRARDRTTVQLAGPGSLVRVVAETGSGDRTARTNPASACVPSGFNSPPTAGFTATTPEAESHDGESLRVAAGETVAFASTATDPDLPVDRLRFEWDLDGGGGYETDGETVRTVVTEDVTVAHRVVDDFGATSDVASLAITVRDWDRRRKLTPSGLDDGDFFGGSVAVTDETLVCGASNDDDGGENAGAAYVYDFADLASGPTKLVPDDLDGRDYFGGDVAVSGETLAVTATGDDDEQTDAGAVYVYDTADLASGPTKLVPDDLSVDALFGISVAIAGRTLVAVALLDNYFPGSIYVYDLADLAGGPTRLSPDGLSGRSSYGRSIAIANETLAVGSRYDDDDGPGAGAVYVYDTTDLASGSTKLTPDALDDGDGFGRSVALAGETLAVGATGDGRGRGAVYVYDTSDLTSGPTKLTPDGLDDGDLFGYSVATGGETLAVGAMYDDEKGTSAGAVYVYDTADLASGPTKLTPDDLGAGDHLGGSVAVADGTVVSGAYRADERGSDAGAAYVFER